MSAETGSEHVQTLGACLSKLAAGDPCPCCGARLRARLVSQPVRPVPALGVNGDTETPILVCPECGCEVSAGDRAEDLGDCHRRSRAA